MADKLIIFDTTLRDGEQSPGASMTKDEKLRIARQLERLKVDVIEAGFAASSNGDFEAVQSIANVIKDSTVCSLSRANDRDIARAAEALKDGRQIIIFPEGTRRPAGAPPDYKSGLGLIYKALNAPIVPIALNSGTAWPRKTRVQRAGTIVAEALEIIPPGLPPRQALKLVQERIETACDRLLLEADARGDDLPDSAKARVAVLRASEPAA
jgi:hypothetical protein